MGLLFNEEPESKEMTGVVSKTRVKIFLFRLPFYDYSEQSTSFWCTLRDRDHE